MKKPTKQPDRDSKVQTFANKLAAEIHHVVDEHVDDLLDRASTYAVDKLRADVASRVAAEEIELEATPPPVTRSSYALASSVDAKPAPKSTVTCSKCHRPGHNARGCKESVVQPDDEDDDETVVAKPLARPDRFAAIEASAKKPGVMPAPTHSTKF